MIYLSLGSNIGHRLAHLQQAFALLQQRYLKNTRCSIILETECLLPANAPPEWNQPFLNMVVIGECDLTPMALLAGLKTIEHELGRPTYYQKWAPRVIDIDILYWNNLTLDTPTLTIPHPELKHRPFLQHLLNLMGFKPTFYFSPPIALSNSMVLSPKLVGIVNLTPDSFSDGGHYQATDAAIIRISQLIAEGATVIELGAQSTRPRAVIQPAIVEYQKLTAVLDVVSSLLQTQQIHLSIDTFHKENIKKLLTHYPITWINDVSNALDDETLQFIAHHHCQLVTMHSLGIPPSQTLPLDRNPIELIETWATQTIKKLMNLGFTRQAIIIDPGIGFGKTDIQNINLLRHIEKLKSLDIKVLVGHSRKSFMQTFTSFSAPERDIETIAISAILAHKVDYLRIHNVKDHQRFFTTQACLT